MRGKSIDKEGEEAREDLAQSLMPLFVGEVAHLNSLPTRPFQVSLDRTIEGVLKGCEVAQMGSGNDDSLLIG